MIYHLLTLGRGLNAVKKHFINFYRLHEFIAINLLAEHEFVAIKILAEKVLKVKIYPFVLLSKRKEIF